jgi:signal transduction histidine kinase
VGAGAKLKSYSRSQAAKIAAYAALTICACLIANLLSKFIYDDNSSLESLVRQDYYNSLAYCGEAARALNDTYSLLQLPEEAALPERAYYYFACGGPAERVLSNVEELAELGVSGYQYLWQEGELSALRLEDGLACPLPWEESGVVDYLAAHSAFSAAALPEASLYVLFPDSLIAQEQAAWEEDRAALLGSAERSLAVLFIIIPLLIYMALVTGRRPTDDELHGGVLDKIYSEPLLLLLLGTLAGGGLLWFKAVEAVRRQIYYTQAGLPPETRQLISLAMIILVGLIVGFTLLLFNALMRKIKAQKLYRHSLTYLFIRWLALPVSRTVVKVSKRSAAATQSAYRQFFVGPDYAEGDPAEVMFYRQRRFLITTAAAMLLLILFLRLDIWPLFLLTLLAEAVVVYNFLRGNQKDMDAVKASVERVLSEQMRLEKLKVELVTNVSHDLKTPLTSIISYVELLSKEQQLSPAARDYVQVLGEKSRRLDRIVSDLFELAKATSDNIPLEWEALDLKRLFAQTLADMEDSIEASGLQLRLSLPEQPLMMLADGSRLYRMLQNVLDNALKYSLSGSRLFVELTEREGRAIGLVKNTAAYEMNFSAADVLRRFSRGDKARSSEGSGLGLAIAQSFCERCGGIFSVSIDGDQFKVSMDFPVHKG